MKYPVIAKIIRSDGLIHDVTKLYCRYEDGEAVGEFRAFDFSIGSLDKNIDLDTLRYIAPEIENVMYNDPATIVFWSDKTKTVAKCSDGDTYNPEMGLMVCIAKKYFGNYEKFRENFEKWSTKAPEKQKEKYYNGRVVCVNSDLSYYTKGKIYDVVNGRLTLNNGVLHPAFSAKTFDELECFCNCELIEVVGEQTNENKSDETFYNGRVICLETRPGLAYTRGKIYNVVDGQLTLNNNCPYPDIRAKTFVELKTRCSCNLLEIKE